MKFVMLMELVVWQGMQLALAALVGAGVWLRWRAVDVALIAGGAAATGASWWLLGPWVSMPVGLVIFWVGLWWATWRTM